MVQIGTHSGTFHCDEALGCWLLRQTSQFKDADIVRSRDPEALKDLDAVIDVGGVYDFDARRFDHHQKEFQDHFGHGFSTRLSSAGLVYKHFGKEVIGKLIGKAEDSPDTHTVWLAVYKQFMEAIDAIDNGVNQYESAQPPRYLSNTHLSARVGALNPSWNEEAGEEATMARFEKAVQLTGGEFTDCVRYVTDSWLACRQHVVAAVRSRKDVDPSGAIIKLPTFCPWKSHLYDIEAEEGISGEIKFCLFQDQSGKWRIQAVSESAGSFVNRKSIKSSWCGLRDAALDEATGLPGGVFVHVGGFIGGHDTYEGALGMAQQSLEA